MESLLSSAADLISSADVWLLALAGLLTALLGIAKLTKTKKDDKYIQMAIDGLNKIKNLLPTKTESKSK